MSTLRSGARSVTYNIRKFRGVNENTDGEINRKEGEAVVMRNYRVTEGGALKVRPGVVTSTLGGSANSAIRGMWSGMLNGVECLVFLKGQTLHFKGADAEQTISGVTVSGEETVDVFFFGGGLYLLTGGEYYRIDTGTLTANVVAGYIPTVVVAAAPDGSGTLYEQVNKLNTTRKIRYNADGTSTDYYVPEGGFVTVHTVTVNGVEQTKDTDYTVEQGNVYGVKAHVHFETGHTPSEGADNVEVEYSVNREQAYRSSVAETASGTIKFATDGTEIVSATEVNGLNAAGSLWVALNSPTDYSVDGNVLTLTSPESWSVISMKYTIGDLRGEVVNMRHSEMFNGAADTRLFLYGDGSNTAIYTGLDENGKATAEYFPDLNEMEIGDSNSPITAMIRHHNRLLAFKPDSTYSVYYNPVSLEDGSLIAGFYVSNVNRSIGCVAEAQAVLCENRPRTLAQGGIYEWKATATSGNITADSRSAQLVSERVARTLKGFDLAKCLAFYDNIHHEYYCVYGSTAVIHNPIIDAWYIYTGLATAQSTAITAMTMFDGKVYYGTTNGKIHYLNENSTADASVKIDAYWESASLDFGRSYDRKYSPTVWVTAVPADDAVVTAAIQTDTTEEIGTGLDFGSMGDMPVTQRARLKSRRFVHYKLKLYTREHGAHAVILTAAIKARYDIPVK